MQKNACILFGHYIVIFKHMIALTIMTTDLDELTGLTRLHSLSKHYKII